MLFRRFAGPNRPSDGIICPPAPLEALMSRSWWQRIWVLQEFSVARRVLFICGDKAVSGAVFEAGLMFFKMQANSIAKLDSNTLLIESLDIGIRGGTLDPDEDEESKRKRLEAESRIIYDLDQHHTIFFSQRQQYQNNNRMHLLQLLLDISGLAHCIALYATDPRDIIFALLGLSTDADALGIRPDYTRSILQVYEQVAVALNKNMYNILPLCVGTDLEAAKRGEWPSWVPDWRKTQLYSKFNPLAGFQAGKGIPSLWIYDEREMGRLGVNYHIIDKVVEVEPLPLSSGQDFHITNAPHLMPPQFQSSILQAAEFAENRTVQLQALENDNDAVWRTLIADQILLDLPEGVGAVRLGAGLIAKQRDVYSAIVNQDLFRFFNEEISDLVQQYREYMNDDVTQTDARIKIHKEHDDGESVPKRFASISPQKPTWLRNFAFTAKRMISQRALITTETGLLCLGPANTEPGHIVALLNDLPTPYVICPVPEREDLGPCGALVGQIYVHGLMDGVPAYRNLPDGVLDII
jgi:hypothetical protein